MLWHRWAPALGPGLFLVVMFATHLTPIYDDALGNRWLHESEHAAYLLSACAMWAAVVGVRRTGAAARVAAVFGVIALSSFLGLILMAAARAADADVRGPARVRSTPCPTSARPPRSCG